MRRQPHVIGGICGHHQGNNCLPVTGGDWHDDAAWDSKKSRGVSIQMERGRDVSVNFRDDVDRFLELVLVFATAPRPKHVVGKVVHYPIARIYHD